MDETTMTVAELIERLSQYPQNLNVNIFVYGAEKGVEKVELVPAYGFCDDCVTIS